MTTLAPTYSVHVDPVRRELQFATSGLFNAETMDMFIAEIGKAVGPLLANGEPIRAFGDLTGFVTQSRDIGDKMAAILAQAEQVGVERTAVLITSSLLKLQYARVSEGRNIKIFDNKAEALEWLRANGEVAA